MVMLLGDWSRSTPPLAVPPLSCTWKVNEVYGEPLAFAAGVNFNSLAVMSATAMDWPAETARPLFVSEPANGSELIFTAAKLLLGLSLGSLNPKSPVVKV